MALQAQKAQKWPILAFFKGLDGANKPKLGVFMIDICVNSNEQAFLGRFRSKYGHTGQKMPKNGPFLAIFKGLDSFLANLR